MGVVFSHKGSFKNLERFLKNYDTRKIINVLEKYGQEGVRALASATPVDSGTTASSWEYKVGMDGNRGLFIEWSNSNRIPGGPPLVILLYYGHGTRNGGYVRGRNFITPVTQPIFDKIADAVWQEVTKT